MYADELMLRDIRLKYITGFSKAQIYKHLQKYNSFDPQSRIYELDQVIATLSFTEYELKLREEIIFCKQQIKVRVDYLTLSCSVIEAQQQQARFQEQIQEALHNMEKITLVPTQ